MSLFRSSAMMNSTLGRAAGPERACPASASRGGGSAKAFGAPVDAPHTRAAQIRRSICRRMRGMVARSIAPGKQELRTASGSCPDDLML